MKAKIRKGENATQKSYHSEKNRMNHAKKIIMRIRINVFRKKVSKSHYSERNKGYIFKTQNVYRMKLLGKKKEDSLKHHKFASIHHKSTSINRKTHKIPCF